MKCDSVKILGVRIDNVDLEEAYKQFIEFINGDRLYTIYTPNPEMVMNAQENIDLKYALLAGDLVVPDGIGLMYASKYLKLGLKDRVAGIDLMGRMLKFLNLTKGSIYLLGARRDVITEAALNIGLQFPCVNIVGFHDGFFDFEEELKVLDDINAKKPDVLFVGLGSPKQELWIDKYKKILNCKVAIGVGGSFDIYSQKLKRAPVWVQKIGMEWLYRFLQEPTRFSRLLKIPQFMFKIITMKRDNSGADI